MKRHVQHAALALLIATATTGCVKKLLDVNLFVVGEQTALEKQVLGTYGALGDDLLAYGSVRGVNDDGTLKVPPTTTTEQRAALQAMMNRQYNKDDIQDALAEGIIGEGNDGLLSLQKESYDGLKDVPADVLKRVVEEENHDRGIILDRLVKTTPGADESRRQEIAWIFANLNQQLAPPKAPVQDRAGSWRAK